MKKNRKRRPYVLPCAIFNGRSPITNKLVGERHRWDGGSWGKGRCDFCHNRLEDVLDDEVKRAG